MNHLGIKFPLPKPEVPVDKRELTVVTNGDSRVYTLPGSATISDEIVFGPTDSYTVTLVDIDEHGNRSLVSETLHGSITDDARPVKPGVIGPIVPANKRSLTETEAQRVKDEQQKKAAEATKASQRDEEQLAKQEQERLSAKQREAEHPATTEQERHAATTRRDAEPKKPPALKPQS